MAKAFPVARTHMLETFARHAPVKVKRLTSAYYGLPIRKEVQQAGVIFIHVPKNAGTTVSEQLYGGHIGHRSARYYQASDPEFFANTPSFALLRDPVDRFVSAFGYVRRGGSRLVPASAAAQAFVSKFESAVACAEHIGRIGHDARDRLDPVFRGQAHYVCDTHAQVIVSKLLYLGYLPATGFEVAGHSISLSSRRNASNGPADQHSGLQAGETTPTHTGTLRDAVEKAYPEDFALWMARPTGMETPQ